MRMFVMPWAIPFLILCLEAEKALDDYYLEFLLSWTKPPPMVPIIR